MVYLEKYKSELTRNLSDGLEIARANIKEAQAQQKLHCDKISKASTLAISWWQSDDLAICHIQFLERGNIVLSPSGTPTNAEEKLVDVPDTDVIFVALAKWS